jgi:hypothetical protein
MLTRSVILHSIVLSTLIACPIGPAHAEDIDGVWISDAAVCQKVFEKRGNRVSFLKGSDLYGNGFIIEGNQIRGRVASCTIKLRKQQGPVINLVAVCSTDIAIDTAHFFLRMDGPDKIIREFSGLPELVMFYQRCSL